MTDAKTIFMDQQYARSKEYLDKLKDLEFMMEFLEGDELAACLDEYVNLVQRYGGRTEHSWQLADELEKNNDSAILINEPLYLENGIPQAQVFDTLCSEGDADMAKRIQMRLQIGKDELGKPITKAINGYSQQEVVTKAAELMIANGYQSQGSLKTDTPLYKDYSQEWLNVYKRSSLRETTYTTYLNLLHKHLIPFFGEMAIGEIATSDIQKFYSERENMARSSVNQMKRILSQIFEAAIEDKYRENNPTKSKRLSMTKKKIERKALSNDDYMDILMNIPRLAYMDQMLLGLIAYTGVRRGEALGIQWKDIDFDSNTITIDRAVTFKGNQPKVGEPKTKAGKRIIPLLKSLKDILVSHRLDDEIFIVGGGMLPITESRFDRSWERIGKKIDLHGAKPHILRHTYITELANKADPKTIQYIAGHSDISTTMNRYMHSRQSNVKEVGKALDEYIASNLHQMLPSSNV